MGLPVYYIDYAENTRKNDEVDDMKECIRIRQIYPDLIFSGFDFVGQEHLGHLVELDEG